MCSSISPLLIFSTLYFMLCPNFFTAHPTSSNFLHRYLLLLNLYTLSLASHCSQEDVKSLTAHIVENYWKALEDVDYVQTFKGLKLRYEQQRERQDNPKLDRWERERSIANSCNCHEWTCCVQVCLLHCNTVWWCAVWAVSAHVHNIFGQRMPQTSFILPEFWEVYRGNDT